MADLATAPLPVFEVDEGFLREAEAVERGERMPTWHRATPTQASPGLGDMLGGDCP